MCIYGCSNIYWKSVQVVGIIILKGKSYKKNYIL